MVFSQQLATLSPSRSCTFRRPFHRALVRVQICVPRQIFILLRLRLSQHHHPPARDYDRRDGYHHLVRSALRRKLSLVVDQFPDWRELECMDFHVFDLVLLDTTPHRWLCLQFVVLQLRGVGMSGVRVSNRHGRVPCGLRICQEDIRRCQGGLKGMVPARGMGTEHC